MFRYLPQVLLTLLLVVPAYAQGDDSPVFGPPVDRRPTEEKTPAANVPQLSPDEVLIERLAKWPGLEGQEAVRSLVLSGGRIVPLLVATLANNDWRIRSGAAVALGDLREQSAFPELQKAARDIANRISIGPFFRAMVRIDPVKATAEILEFLPSADARVAKEAFDALPTPIDGVFTARLKQLIQHEDATVRQRALIISRRLNPQPPADIYFSSLGDPAPRVALEASAILTERGDRAVYARLRSIVLEGALRPASYAILALVNAEDRSVDTFLDDSPELKKRLLVFLNVRGEFENAVAAIAFANISMRSIDPEVRQFADGALMDMLLSAAAGGVIHRDYIAVKDLAFRKAAQISGLNFGENSDRWLAWRRETRAEFQARRELRRLEKPDVAHMTLRFAKREGPDSLNLAFRAGIPEEGSFQILRPIYVDQAEMEALAAELNRLDFFSSRGMQPNADWTGDFVEVVVAVGSADFRRPYYGEFPSEMKELETFLSELASRHRWQSLWNSRSDKDFARWFKKERERLGQMSADERQTAVAEMALAGYSAGSPQTRRDALMSWRAAGPEFIVANRDRFVELLQSPEMRAERATEVIEILTEQPGVEVSRAVLSALPLFLDSGREPALKFLAARPTEELVALDESGHAELRVLLIEALSQRSNEAAARARLCEIFADPDPRVQQAFPRAFPEAAPAQLLADLKAAIETADGSRRLRLIEVWGGLTPKDDLTQLMNWYDNGSSSQKETVVRALAHCGGPAAQELLFDLAVKSDLNAIRLEAQTMISRSDDVAVRQKLREVLQEVHDEERLIELIRTAVMLFDEDVERELGQFLQSDLPAVRRQTTLYLAPRLAASTIPELLNMLLDKAESGRAWEYLELITCQELPATSTEEAYVSYQKFWDEHRDEPQTRWFMAGLDRESLPSANLLGYLNGNNRDLRSIALLLKALDSNKWFIRVNAHFHLGVIRGEDMGALTRNSTPAEIERIRTRWNEWYKALLANL